MKQDHRASPPHQETSAPAGEGIPPKWQWHYETLLRLSAKLARERDERAEALRAARERGGADRGDTASGEREKFQLLAELSSEETELQEVEAALGRIRNGTYGICDITALPIAEERLRALPWTRFSRDAAARREAGTLKTG